MALPFSQEQYDYLVGKFGKDANVTKNYLKKKDAPAAEPEQPIEQQMVAVREAARTGNAPGIKPSISQDLISARTSAYQQKKTELLAEPGTTEEEAALAAGAFVRQFIDVPRTATGRKAPGVGTEDILTQEPLEALRSSFGRQVYRTPEQAEEQHRVERTAAQERSEVQGQLRGAVIKELGSAQKTPELERKVNQATDKHLGQVQNMLIRDVQEALTKESKLLPPTDPGYQEQRQQIVQLANSLFQDYKNTMFPGHEYRYTNDPTPPEGITGTLQSYRQKAGELIGQGLQAALVREDEAGQIVETPLATGMRDVAGLIRPVTEAGMQALTYEIGEDGEALDTNDYNYKVSQKLDEALAILRDPEESDGRKLAATVLATMGTLVPIHAAAQRSTGERAQISTGNFVKDVAVGIAQARSLGDDFADIPMTKAFYESIGAPDWAPFALGLGVEIALPITPMPLAKFGVKQAGRTLEELGMLSRAATGGRVGGTAVKSGRFIQEPLAIARDAIRTRAAMRISAELDEVLGGGKITDELADYRVPKVLSQAMGEAIAEDMSSFLSRMTAAARAGKLSKPMARIVDELSTIDKAIRAGLDEGTAISREVTREAFVVLSETRAWQAHPKAAELYRNVVKLAAEGNTEAIQPLMNKLSELMKTDTVLSEKTIGRIAASRIYENVLNKAPNDLLFLTPTLVATEKAWNAAKGKVSPMIKELMEVKIGDYHGKSWYNFANGKQIAKHLIDEWGPEAISKNDMLREVFGKVLTGKPIDEAGYRLVVNAAAGNLIKREISGAATLRFTGPAAKRAAVPAARRFETLRTAQDAFNFIRTMPDDIDLFTTLPTVPGGAFGSRKGVTPIELMLGMGTLGVGATVLAAARFQKPIRNWLAKYGIGAVEEAAELGGKLGTEATDDAAIRAVREARKAGAGRAEVPRNVDFTPLSQTERTKILRPFVDAQRDVVAKHNAYRGRVLEAAREQGMEAVEKARKTVLPRADARIKTQVNRIKQAAERSLQEALERKNPGVADPLPDRIAVGKAAARQAEINRRGIEELIRKATDSKKLNVNQAADLGKAIQESDAEAIIKALGGDEFVADMEKRGQRAAFQRMMVDLDRPDIAGEAIDRFKRSFDSEAMLGEHLIDNGPAIIKGLKDDERKAIMPMFSAMALLNDASPELMLASGILDMLVLGIAVSKNGPKVLSEIASSVTSAVPASTALSKRLVSSVSEFLTSTGVKGAAQRGLGQSGAGLRGHGPDLLEEMVIANYQLPKAVDQAITEMFVKDFQEAIAPEARYAHAASNAKPLIEEMERLQDASSRGYIVAPGSARTGVKTRPVMGDAEDTIQAIKVVRGKPIDVSLRELGRVLEANVEEMRRFRDAFRNSGKSIEELEETFQLEARRYEAMAEHHKALARRERILLEEGGMEGAIDRMVKEYEARAATVAEEAKVSPDELDALYDDLEDLSHMEPDSEAFSQWTDSFGYMPTSSFIRALLEMPPEVAIPAAIFDAAFMWAVLTPSGRAALQAGGRMAREVAGKVVSTVAPTGRLIPASIKRASNAVVRQGTYYGMRAWDAMSLGDELIARTSRQNLELANWTKATQDELLDVPNEFKRRIRELQVRYAEKPNAYQRAMDTLLGELSGYRLDGTGAARGREALPDIARIYFNNHDALTDSLINDVLYEVFMEPATNAAKAGRQSVPELNRLGFRIGGEEGRYAGMAGEVIPPDWNHFFVNTDNVRMFLKGLEARAPGLSGAGLKGAISQRKDPFAAATAWALKSIHQEKLNAAGQRFADLHPELVFQNKGITDALPQDLKALMAMEEDTSLIPMQQVINNLYEQGSVDIVSLEQRIIDALFEEKLGQVGYDGLMDIIEKAKPLILSQTVADHIDKLKALPIAERNTRLKGIYTHDILPEIYRNVYDSWAQKMYGWLNANGLAVPSDEATRLAAIKPKIVQLADLSKSGKTHGINTILDRELAGMIERLGDDIVNGTLEESLKSMRAGRGLNVLEDLYQMARRSTIGGLLGGFPFPNTRFMFNNNFTAPLMASITTPGYTATALKSVPASFWKVRVGLEEALPARYSATMRKWLTGKGLLKSDKVLFTSPTTGETWTRGTLEAAIQRNNIRSSQVGFEFGDALLEDMRRITRLDNTFGEASKTKNVARYLRPDQKNVWNIWAEQADFAFREGIFVAALKEGKTEAEAAELARRILLDYGQVSGNERKLFARHILFYTFQRQMTMDVISSALRPGARTNLAKQIRFAQHQQEAVGAWEREPDYARNRLWNLMGEDVEHSTGILGGLQSPPLEAFNSLVNAFYYPTHPGTWEAREATAAIGEAFLNAPWFDAYTDINKMRPGEQAPHGRVPNSFVMSIQGTPAWDLAFKAFEMEAVPFSRRYAGEPTYEQGEQYQFSTSSGASKFKTYLLGMYLSGLQRNVQDWGGEYARANGVEGAELKRHTDGTWWLHAAALQTPIKAPDWVQIQDRATRSAIKDLQAITKE